jgi:hypothetical protein
LRLALACTPHQTNCLNAGAIGPTIAPAYDELNSLSNRDER